MKETEQQTDKKKKKLRTYLKPTIDVIELKEMRQLLAASPPIGTTPIVTPPGVDNDDTELDDENNGVPAKRFNLWEDGRD